MASRHEGPSPNILDRALNLFTEVRGGEGLKAIVLALNIFLLMTSYYIIKPVREALILAGEGAVAKSYLVAGMAALLIFLIPAYSKLVDRLGRNRLIGGVTAFFIGCLVLFWVLSKSDVPKLEMAFFVWVGIFNVMIIAQFWSFANDVYTNEAGKRLFPIVAVGGSIGAAVGSGVAKMLLDFLGVYELLLVAAVLLGICILLTVLVGMMGDEAEEAEEGGSQGDSEHKSMGFDLLFKHKYLGLIALLVLILNLVNTNGEYILGQMAQDHYEEQTEIAVAAAIAAGEPLMFGDNELGDPNDEEVQGAYLGSSIGSFYSTFFFWVNVLGVAFQLLLVGRLVKYGGIKAALFMLPIIAFGTYALILAFPILGYARIGKTAENATDYSVNNTVRHMLFLPTSREIKYKAKQAVDSFMQRAGDLVSAGIVFLATSAALGTAGFAALNLGVVVIWLFIALAIVKEHKRIEAGELHELTDMDHHVE